MPRALFIACIAILLISSNQIARSQSAPVSFAWNANPEANIAGYRLYYGTIPGVYSQVLDVGKVTTATVSNLAGGIVYFAAATAYNTEGLESLFSSEVTFTAPSQTPSPSPGPTTTPVPTSTPSPTATPMPSSTPGDVSISGRVAYCSDPLSGPLPNVTLSFTGSASGSMTSDDTGNYRLSPLPYGGSYIVTPTKTALTPGAAGINSVDVIAARQHFLHIDPLPPGCRLQAADVNGDGTVNLSDTMAIQRFYLGMNSGTQSVGVYQFMPASRSYLAVNNDQNAQDYDGLILGDIAGSLADGLALGAGESAGSGSPDAGEVAPAVDEVSLPHAAVDSSTTDFVADVTVSTIDENDRLIGFQGDFTFDERVVTFQNPPVQGKGLTEANWNVSANVLPGTGPIRRLRISAFSNDFAPLSGSGPLFELRMTRVEGTPGANSALTWAQAPDHFIFIDADLGTQAPATAEPGAITVTPVH